MRGGARLHVSVHSEAKLHKNHDIQCSRYKEIRISLRQRHKKKERSVDWCFFPFFDFLKASVSYFPWCSSDTVNFLRPLARRDASTRRPFFDCILWRKPCLFTRLLLCGWNVLFIVLSYFLFVFIVSFSKSCSRYGHNKPTIQKISGCKITHSF